MGKIKTLTVIQAYDGAVIDEIHMQDEADVEALLAQAHALYRDFDQWLSAHQRIEVLQKLIGLMQPRSEELALLIAREGGKPLAAAQVEVARAIVGVEIAIKEIDQLKGENIPMDLTAAGAGHTAYTIKEPIGVVVAVSAFNHPLNLIIHQVIPAVAVGCPVIVKPAGRTPLSCLRLVEMLHSAMEAVGVPTAWCQVCVCDRNAAQKLVTDARVAFMTFIGSARVGWELRRQLAPGTRCSLEHGGVAPVIVAADADLKTTIPALVTGGYYHSGQVCVSVQRVFVDNDIKTEFLNELSKQVGELVVGDPTDIKTVVGPLIRPSEVDRVEEWVNEAIEAGAECVIGGKRFNDHFYTPTILVDPPHDAKVSSQEIFGPVVCVYGYDDVQNAITLANALPVAFQAAVFTKNTDAAMDVVNKLDAAAVMVNDHTAFRVDWMPFAGRRMSGLGTGGIRYTMEDMTQDKLVVTKA